MAGMLNIKIKDAKSMFFDRQKILNAVDKATRKNLARAGGYIRTTARRSMKKVRARPKKKTPKAIAAFKIRKRIAKQEGKPEPQWPTERTPSLPGKAPNRQSDLLRKGIFFSFDPTSKSMVVGPVKFNRNTQNVPSLLEFGGTFRGRNGQTGRIAPRPYMGPAMQKAAEKGKIGGRKLWADSVR